MSELADLRRQRQRCHIALKQHAAQTKAYEARLARIEAAIVAIDPAALIPARTHKPNLIFVRGEMTRLVLTVLRDADRPLLMREIAAAMLTTKGAIAPDIVEHTHRRLSCVLTNMHKRGRIQMVSVRDKWRWMGTVQSERLSGNMRRSGVFD